MIRGMTCRRSPVSRGLVLLAGLGVAAALLLEKPLTAGAHQSRRIVAIGDVHGALEQFATILQQAGLIDAQRRWTGGNAVLVQTGDVFDRGDGVRGALDLLMRLEDEARRAGGRVEALLGNHEIMNLIGEFRDVSPATYAAFADERSADRQRRAYQDYLRIAKRQQRPGQLAPLGREEWNKAHPIGFVEYVDALGRRGRYGRWLRSHAVVAAIDGTAFMHAGINPEVTTGGLDDVNRTAARDLALSDDARAMLVKAQLLTEYATLDEALLTGVAEINRIAEALKNQADPGEHVTREFVDRLQAFLKIDKSSLLDPQGPLWFRGFAQWEDSAAPQLSALAARLGVSRFVTGHTPSSAGRIRARFDNQVFLIDTGMLSTYFRNGRASALELQDSRVTAIYSDGRESLVPPRAARAFRGRAAAAASAASR
jgi:calcineurin-like phosphoesterase family protein